MVGKRQSLIALYDTTILAMPGPQVKRSHGCCLSVIIAVIILAISSYGDWLIGFKKKLMSDSKLMAFMFASLQVFRPAIIKQSADDLFDQ